MGLGHFFFFLLGAKKPSQSGLGLGPSKGIPFSVLYSFVLLKPLRQWPQACPLPAVCLRPHRERGGVFLLPQAVGGVVSRAEDPQRGRWG